ncbi:hrr1, partial [Symbiodinium sp. KB8]
MMERLLENGLPNVELQAQGRMLPGLSKLLKSIYPHLKDNTMVTSKLVAPACVASEVFFWHCPHPEEEGERSRVNKRECDRAVQLARFFISQGYKPKQITVLAPYQGQVALIKNTLREEIPKFLAEMGQEQHLSPFTAHIDPVLLKRGNRVDITSATVRQERVYPVDGQSAQPGCYRATLTGTHHASAKDDFVEVRLVPDAVQPDQMPEVSSIDRYQGAENDIVIVSLVRSNQQN